MDSTQSLFGRKYLDLFLRRKFFIITLLLLSLPVGLGVYLYTPKVYQATSLLSYQKQKISPNDMSPDLASRISDIVSTLTQIVISRTNLEQTISSLGLYQELRRELPMEDVIEIMRRHIVIQPMREGDIFTISFSGSDPRNVVKVTNALAAKFIEENLKYRQERASETSEYTSDELLMAKEGMDRKENAMRDYKLKHYYEMPEQSESNVVRLISLQEQYQATRESIQEMERTLVLVQDQLSNRKKFLKQAAMSALAEEGAADGGVQSLEAMKLKLERLRGKYTEKHPEVKRMKKIVVKMEKEAAKHPASSAGKGSSLNSQVAFDSVIQQLEAQRKTVQISLGNTRQEMVQLKEKIAQYEKWVASAPIREAEWSSLTREYDQLKRHYDYLVSQDLQAKSMLNLERKQQGSQFKIEDPARFPEKPIKPNFMIIVGGAALIGLGLGAGLTLALDFFDTSFRNGDSLEPFLGVPLISSVPFIDIPIEQKRKSRKFVLGIILLVCGFLAVLALFFIVWRRGLIVI